MPAEARPDGARLRSNYPCTSVRVPATAHDWFCLVLRALKARRSCQAPRGAENAMSEEIPALPLRIRDSARRATSIHQDRVDRSKRARLSRPHCIARWRESKTEAFPAS
jgi:hypothetical protein